MKKKYCFFIIFSLCFLFNISVKAKVYGSTEGAPLYSIIDKIGASTFQMAEKDEVCIYESQMHKDNYVVIYFEYSRNDGGYIISDITSQFGDNYYRAHPSSKQYFMVQTDSQIVMKEGEMKGVHWWQPRTSVQYFVYKGEDIEGLCMNMKVGFFGGQSDVRYVPINANTETEATYVSRKDNEPDADGNTVKMVFDTIDSKTGKLTEDQKEGLSCDIKLDTKGLTNVRATLKWDNNYGWYLNTGANQKICFGVPIGYNDIATDFNKDEDFSKTFKCEDYCISSKVTNNDSSCLAYFVPKKGGQCDENVSSDITHEGHSSGTKIANYIAYENTSSSLVISVYKTETGINVEAKTNITSKIKNATDPTIVSRFNGDSKEFPTYINQSGDSYEFSDMRKEGVSQVFINMAAINSSVDWEEEVYETCEDLFGGGFLEFLNETVFKILYIGIPILLIVLTTIDFAKVIFADDKDEIQKAGKKFGKRVVVAILIYLVPTILIFISNLMGADEVKDCAKFFQNIGNSDTSDIDFGE